MPEGPVLAYLVDFLEGGEVAFRVYYQDAPGAEPIGWVGADVLAGRPVDVALLNAGNFEAVDRPERIATALGARTVVLHHWENFFDPEHRDLDPITDVGRYRTRLIAQMGSDAGRVRLLAPGVAIGF
jgi:hypothetical protein